MAKATKSMTVVDKDPNLCFVLFSNTYFNAINVEAGLASLLHQVQKIDGDRKVKRMEYLRDERKLIIEFERSEEIHEFKL